MTSPSKLTFAASVLFGGLVLALVGCGSSDVGTPNAQKVDSSAALKQSGDGRKAAAGGGGLEDPVPAAPGEKTGILQGGRK